MAHEENPASNAEPDPSQPEYQNTLPGSPNMPSRTYRILPPHVRNSSLHSEHPISRLVSPASTRISNGYNAVHYPLHSARVPEPRGSATRPSPGPNDAIASNSPLQFQNTYSSQYGVRGTSGMNSPPTSPVASAGRDQGNNPDAQYLHNCHLPDCGITFDMREVSKHISDYHLHGVDQWDTIICPLDETKMRARNLARHYETKHLKARVSCPHCPREYSRRDLLARHLRESCPSRLQG